MKIIDGKTLAKEIIQKVKTEIESLGFAPGLAVFLVGHDDASELYVKLKEKACKKVGIEFHKYTSDTSTSQEELLSSIEFLNNDPMVHAILVQLPLPEPFNDQEIINKMDFKKDVDGFHPETVKAFLSGDSQFVPGLSMGIVRLIESTEELLEGKHAVILANSDVFSRPLEKLLQDKGLTVEVVKSSDKDFQDKTVEADILIVAAGRPNWIKADMIKENAILIDVGTTKVDEKIVGDIDFESVDGKAGWITPVPGGVGPVTVAMLLENTVELAKQQQ
jgi:methylenetetrahydrofolate dehydrogenase (NADP+) / methenyltetrahydrofolate cyclohydrolase